MMGMPDSDRIRWVALSLIPSLGARLLDRLLDAFGSLEALLAAETSELRRVPGIGPKLSAAIAAIDLDATRAAMAGWGAEGIAILLRGDVDYPIALDALSDAPPVLFMRGAVTAADERAVALVGTRHPSRAGQHVAVELAACAADHGWTVVSGLAAGIDGAAHQGALAAGGRTLAVLGSGMRNIYPPPHRALAGQIAAQGAVLAEVSPDARPHSAALVARNRLISGLSRAVIVVESGVTSGSMHAARFAGDQGRLVLAVDNPSPGNRQLIASGARPLPDDVQAWEALWIELGRDVDL